jgi:phage tail sheath protein FI
MNDYKTPGVYIEEIPKLPPSIASVETAIPAFTGYTEKAQLKEQEIWSYKCQRGSLLCWSMNYVLWRPSAGNRYSQ